MHFCQVLDFFLQVEHPIYLSITFSIIEFYHVIHEFHLPLRISCESYSRPRKNLEHLRLLQIVKMFVGNIKNRRRKNKLIQGARGTTLA